MLAGALLRAMYFISCAVLLSEPHTQKKAIALLFMEKRSVLLFWFNRDILRTTVAARNEMKAPANGAPDSPSPSFTMIGLMPHTRPAPIPRKIALRGMPEVRLWFPRSVSRFRPAAITPPQGRFRQLLKQSYRGSYNIPLQRAGILRLGPELVFYPARRVSLQKQNGRCHRLVKEESGIMLRLEVSLN